MSDTNSNFSFGSSVWTPVSQMTFSPRSRPVFRHPPLADNTAKMSPISAGRGLHTRRC
ncbi:MAG: hypothetical protein IPP07_14590 [Holophagales bacterium]|nr:hypothetical protein [Holophagales bacterium]